MNVHKDVPHCRITPVADIGHGGYILPDAVVFTFLTRGRVVDHSDTARMSLRSTAVPDRYGRLRCRTRNRHNRLVALAHTNSGRTCLPERRI